MTTPSVVFSEQLGGQRVLGHAPAEPLATSASAASWGAIFAGAAATAALSLILLILGTGLGLSSVSPWAQSGITAATFGVTTIIWVTVTQIIASGAGGYLAGRLRTKWVSVHTDEVYFRDTVHGFLSWAIASIATAALLVSVIGSIIGSGVQAGAAVASGVASPASAAVSAAASDTGKAGNDGGSMAYFIDALLRKDAAAATAAATPVADGAPSATSSASTAEIARIFMTAMRTGAIPADDLRYVGQAVSQRTGLSQADAEKRVSATFTRAQAALRDAEIATKDAADKARKASAYAALWLFISLLIGAFTASLAATFGGRQRDH